MSTSKVLAFIPGTGNMGSALAAIYTKLGHNVIVSSRDASKAQTVATSILQSAPNGKIEGLDNAAAAKKADIVFWGVQGPLAERHQLLKSLENDLNGKIVIDMTNIFYLFDEKDWGQISAVEQNRDIVPGAKWSMAFKSIFKQALDEPVTNGVPRDVQVCADDQGTMDTVKALVNETGFRALDCGPLKYARIVELIGPKFVAVVNQKNSPPGQFGSWRFF